MAIIIVSRAILCLFSCIIAWCGLTRHIGFTVQNRFTWGLRGAYIPLIQRSLLNFICVCITAIWPLFQSVPNTLASNVPTTTQQMVGFTIFWLLSFPFLFIRPERFKKPFFFSSLGCGIAMLCMMIWSLSVARGVGPVFYQGQKISSTSRWSISWLIMAGLNQAIGQKAAGMANESDFSRYANSRWAFVLGTCSVQWLVGILVSLGGLVTTAACEIIYGKIYWNSPDLMMIMMDNGHGLLAARAGVFFLALAFTFAILFQKPATFVTVLSSFSVFLAPLMGVMVCDYFFIRHRKIRLRHLYRTESSDYWFINGFNWRVIPYWIAGWAPTIGGFSVSAGGKTDALDALFQLYYTAFFTGFSISFATFYVVNLISPIKGAGDFDEYDDWATFSPKEAAKLGIVPNDNAEGLASTRLGASGYKRRAPRSDKEQGLDVEMPIPVEVSMGPGKQQ
ncbi:hypothetical protein EK21DRAFT_86555 [Setomelanomma holmii]|uniref:Uncharacterized protein n=1 Tax=Setomelanomma holmii TaxID=210430 RepID=A0A9P4LQD3_9PLEO|nr:hypothetical protein EK21DRAFT_86555 [Setomelanomma holmii]